MTFSPSLTPNFTIQVQFSEPVSGFQPSDLILQNAVLVSPSSGVLPTQSRFQIIVSAINSGPVGVSLPRNKVLDSVGNGNEASNAVNMIYAPAVVPDEEMNYTISLLGPNVSNDFRSVFEVNFEDPIDGLSLYTHLTLPTSPHV